MVQTNAFITFIVLVNMSHEHSTGFYNLTFIFPDETYQINPDYNVRVAFRNDNSVVFWTPHSPGAIWHFKLSNTAPHYVVKFTVKINVALAATFE